MNIRKAEISDSVQVAQCLLLAMEEIVYEFIGFHHRDKAKTFMRHFTSQKNNQYSYENCWIVEDKEQIVAAINLYNGADLSKLRTPVLEYLENQFQRKFIPDDETQAGEIYIDTLGVLSECRGKGVGTGLLNFVIEEYVEKRGETVGLLVDEENMRAKNLYLKLGFKIAGRKTLMGKTMVHLQMCP